MSQIKQLQPKEGVTLLAVKVPEGAHNLDTVNNVLWFRYQEQGQLRKFSNITLPEGNWQLLGKATEIPESVWHTLMYSIEGAHGDSYFHYCFTLPNGEYEYVSTATESAMSLLAKHEVDPNSVILMKQND